MTDEVQGDHSRSRRRWLLAEVPAIPGCATQGETLDELVENLREAIEGCLSVEPLSFTSKPGRIMEIAV
ncbi:type II toxin-antitoxin system HicB family antitoxin [Mesorhizobium muleiense]|uniref:type II toxin-antitoxin system HicB family antitoxin n=1 Tax=Mesorhizobium muleiense TaxID=1004279 RepID=UPI000AFB9B68|nr:type II toxin-antitoxin system HicB family antitoxin [Mesorhizobium muleiense]MCF6103162.1 type II toxin-antitoxin system HicB family antitoxin [Mesorhizobium muleiense]